MNIKGYITVENNLLAEVTFKTIWLNACYNLIKVKHLLSLYLNISATYQHFVKSTTKNRSFQYFIFSRSYSKVFKFEGVFFYCSYWCLSYNFWINDHLQMFFQGLCLLLSRKYVFCLLQIWTKTFSLVVEVFFGRFFSKIYWYVWY